MQGVARSIADFAQTARTIAKAQAAQAAAGAAVTKPGAVPDGLVAGGLWVDPAAVKANPALWSGAALPISTPATAASGAAGRAGATVVTVDQTSAAADLTWSTFNIAAGTTLRFNQGASSWTVLNRVSDPAQAPSQILGAISAPGEVLVLNPNGIIFGAGSQVNVGALVASTANLAAAQFSSILSAQTSSGAYLPVFTGASAPVTVKAGASITANAPVTASDRGGYVLLLGQTVENDGQITTASGQTILAAGQSFVVRAGYSTDNPTSTTLGLEVAPTGTGGVTNTGLIQATTGDITLTGETIQQSGVLLSSSSLAQRGTIHLLTNATDTAASITFAPGSLTAIQPQDDGTTATDTARAALIAQSATNNIARGNPSLLSNQPLSNQVAMSDQQYESRIEIVSGGTVEFQNGSLNLATGGQLALYAAGRVMADAGSSLSVAGSIDTLLPASANTLQINVQGYDLRDAPANRDTGALSSQNVNVAIGSLVQIANASDPSSPYEYTSGGLLEVSGYLAGVGHTIGEWTSVGGSISMQASQLVTQPGSVFNISGGIVSYAAGSTANTWLLAGNGALYNVNNAPSNVTYTGIYSGFTTIQPRWGITQTFYSPLIAPSSTYSSGYSVGRDAGSLTISAPTAILEGAIAAGVSPGEFQSAARPASTGDPFTLAQTVVPLPGSLTIGAVTLGNLPATVATTGLSVTAAAQPLASSLGLATPIPANRLDTTALAASVLNNAGLGGLTLVTQGTISVDAPVTLADGGAVSLLAPNVEVSASLTARGGQVTIGNYSTTYFTSHPSSFTDATDSSGAVVAAVVTLGAGGTIDTRGVFSNLAINPASSAGEAFVNGGAVTIDTSGVVTLASGSTIDASAGGAVLANRSFKGGTGGAISITAYDPADTSAAASSIPVTIGGTLLALGSGSVPCTACLGGALSLTLPAVSIGAEGPAGTVSLTADFFSAGFSSYTVTGQNGVTVAPGTKIAPVQPIEEFTAATALTAGGANPSVAFIVGLPPLYTPNTAGAVMVQRPGSSITLRAGVAAGAATGGITIGAGAAISVDPSQAITLEALGIAPVAGVESQITIDGTLTAPSGAISVMNDEYEGTSASLSIWLGATSVLDVSAQAVTALDTSGRVFGVVPAGGTIHVGGLSATTTDGSIQSTNAFVVVQPGAVISAAGSVASLDPSAGQTLSARAAGKPNGGQLVPVASNGGSIAFDSESGIFLGGQVSAPAGGAGAQGGTFSINLVTPDYSDASRFSPPVQDVPAYATPRELVVGNGQAALAGVSQPGVALAASAFGAAGVSTGQLGVGGFDVVNLSSGDAILFAGSTTLSAGRSITLTTAILGNTELDGAVTVTAPYVTLAGSGLATTSGVTFQRGGGAGSGIASPNWQPSAQAGQATLQVNAANIDVSGNLYIGVKAPIISVPVGGSTACAIAACPVADLPGFATMTLSSSGDIRFLGSTSVGGYTTLTTPGDLSLTAGQVYPVAGANAIVTAGFTDDAAAGVANYNGAINISSAPGGIPAPPLTAGGQLTLRSGTIDQGGVLRAPDGQITLGTLGPNGQYAPALAQNAFSTQVVLEPGSVTSVSMNGLTIPFGGTSDGTTYTLNGAPVTPPAPLLSINAQSVQAQAGSTIDVSGGGVLSGAGFVAGRGGSTDVLQTPLLALTASGTVTEPSAKTNLVFAIVPGFQDTVAPPAATATAFGGPLPSAGDQITISAGVPGLAAGTYTLLPGSDALLPGAFRVELATTNHTVLAATTALGNGSYLANGYRRVANTSIAAALPIEVTVTPGAAVRLDAQYNETDYASFELSQAALFGQARTTLTLPADSKTLAFGFAGGASTSGLALTIAGAVTSAPATDGVSGVIELSALAPIEVLAPGAAPTAGLVSVLAADLDALHANALVVGAALTPTQSAGQLRFGSFNASLGAASAVYLRAGASLSAAQVFLVASGGITVERGASIDTIGAGTPSLTSSGGLTFNNEGLTVLAVSNAAVTFQPATLGGTIGIGVCAASCSGAASLLSAGTIATATTGAVTIDQTTRFGASTIDLSASVVNFGTPPSGTAGLTFTAQTLQSLIAGDAALGVPGLQQLILTASSSVNFYGDFSFGGASGQSPLQSLQLNSPAMYGAPGVNASLTTGTFIWNGVLASGGTASQTPGNWSGTGGATGASSLSISASTIVFGYGPSDQAQNQVALDRLILGFGDVTMTASQSISGNNRGTLSVYQSATQSSGGTLTAPALTAATGGNLTLTTPLLTGAAGSVLTITTGGNLTVAAPATALGATSVTAQGASLTLNGANIAVDSAIVLPSGQLIVDAMAGGISLGAQSQLNLAGVTTTLFDQGSAGWGGDITLQAAAGGITQQPGGTIDVSAANANAGSLTLLATGAVNLAGKISGGAEAGYDSGSVSVRGDGFGAADPASGFVALNAAFDTGGFYGARSFELLSGDLAIAAGTTVAANNVTISVDGGALTVAGTVNAAGVTPGTIRLSAAGNLTLAAGAVLDAHGSVAQVDSYGQSIDAENTGSVTLTSASGTLSIAPASATLVAPVINVSAASGVTCASGACGQVTLNASRLGAETAGDISISVPSGVSIQGAGSVIVNAFQSYSNAPIVAGNATITQTWFNQAPGADATAFMNAAVSPAGVLNPVLTTKLAGLMTPELAPVFHLRPGVEVDSPAQSAGLTVSTDLDLSGARYQSVAVPGRTAGLTEPGALVIRSGDGLTILGSINDGFAGVGAQGGAPQLCETAATCTTTSGGLFTYWELAQMLPANADGSLALSWSIRLVAGADLAAADSRIVLPSGTLAAEAAVAVPGSNTATDPAGSIALYDPHPQPFNSALSGTSASELPGWSVIRTGTGDLDVLAGGSIDEQSTYAIYTAGTSAAPAAGGADNLPRGFSSAQVTETLSPGTVAFSAPGRTITLVSGTVLTDATTKQTFTLADTVVVAGTRMTVGGVAVASVPVQPAVNTGLPEPTGRALVVSGQRTVTAKIAAAPVTGLVNTVLGPNGQPTNNGVTLESLVSSYQAYYPEAGGNLLISAGGSIAGYLPTPTVGSGLQPIDGVGNWLWRQGDGSGASGASSTAATAWWINFGTLALPLTSTGATAQVASLSTSPVPTLTGFTGIGTLGGGNATILAASDIGSGASGPIAAPVEAQYTVSRAIDVTVASTGRVAAGATGASGIVQTGGGVLAIQAGGALNGGGGSIGNNQANGTLTGTRGSIDVQAGSIGQIVLSYGSVNYNPATGIGDPRAALPLTPSQAVADGGPIVVPGDASVSLRARGDLVLGGVGDPTRESEQNLTPAGLAAGGTASGMTWFSLWQPGTAIHLDSAGGNLVVSTQAVVATANGEQDNALATDNRFLYPPTLTAEATGGSIYAGTTVNSSGTAGTPSSIELAPSPTGQLELLAAGSIYGDSQSSNGAPQSFDVSGASTAALPSPLNPAFEVVTASGNPGSSNLAANIGAGPLSLFAFGADTASGSLHAGDPLPALVYAGGDIVDLRYGETLCYGGTACPSQASSGITPQIWYVSGKAVRIMAGGAIVEPGTIYIIQPNSTVGAANPKTTDSVYTSTSGLIVNSNPTDVSVIQAGGDIIYANATVAGPGQLYVQAGGTVYQGNQGVLQSLGPLNDGALTAGPSRTGGAGITLAAGISATGPAWETFAQTYLAPAMGYDTTLNDYLAGQYGYTGGVAKAPAYFEALPIEQQRAFLLQIYFDELRDSGREFTNPDSVHYKSYIRGRTAIATLFPAGSAATGGITLFGDSGISTDFGGEITLLTPGGATSLGNTTPPPASLTPPGVLTQGTGDVDIFSLGNVLLGQSRVFTTFGGSIVIWSEQGDINAGRGSKTTQLVTSTLITYDDFGQITLTPGIPTSGAGIATLAPIPGTPSGDVDLIAPLGVIDAGEAGIRVSGNANLAALTIVNAANVQVGGHTTGLPTIAAPNVSALSAASAAAAAATQAAQAASAAATPNSQPAPSTITVDLLGFGDQ